MLLIEKVHVMGIAFEDLEHMKFIFKVFIIVSYCMLFFILNCNVLA